MICLLMMLSVTRGGGLNFEDRARSSSFVWKCQTALGCVGVFSESTPATDAEFEFLLKWLDEDIEKMGQSPEAKSQTQRMTTFRNALKTLLRSDSFDSLPQDWEKPETGEDLAILLTLKLEAIARHADLTLETNLPETDN